MRRAILPFALIFTYPLLAHTQQPPPSAPDALVQKIQSELGQPLFNEGKPVPSIPHGEMLHGTITNSPIFPGTENDFQVYVPAQYDPAKPACVLIKLDGFGAYEGNVLDDLIERKEIPVIIGVGIRPGAIFKDPPGTPQRAAVRYNRSYEFDSVNDRFPDFILQEVLPAVQKLQTRDGRAIHLSTDGNDHAATGGSTGGIGSFTLAWRRPDQFTRVYDIIGTFVSMRGGHEYPALIRKTDPKPIRVFLEDGKDDAWNALFGSWFDANLNMESALGFAGYDVAHAWGQHGHDGRAGAGVFPDVMRWLWRDYPAPIRAGVSKNTTLQEIELPGEGWQKIPDEFGTAAGLAADARGEVYLSDPLEGTISRLDADNKGTVFARQRGVAGQAVGPDGTLYGVVPGEKKIVAFDAQGHARTVADGIAGRAIIAAFDGTLYVSEPGEHPDMPSRLWKITPDGGKTVLDEGLPAASGIAFAPDGALLFAAENTTKWIDSYVVQPDGSLADKEPFYWLHMTDIPTNSGTEDLAVDTHGNLYAATRMGIQVCDQNGRVRAILPLPPPGKAVRSVCFGGEHFDFLYATDGTQVFRRKLKVPGVAPWAKRTPYPKQGAG